MQNKYDAVHAKRTKIAYERWIVNIFHMDKCPSIYGFWEFYQTFNLAIYPINTREFYITTGT